MTRTTIGIDLGGSSVRAISRDQTGDLVGRYESTHNASGGREVLSIATEAARAVGLADCVGIGIGLPGQVAPLTGEVSLAVNLGIGSKPFGLGAAIEQALDIPTALENDVRTAALGMDEILAMRGNPTRSLTLVSIGTGISAGVVIDGVLLRGAHGMAGEVGHVVVEEDGPLCGCGQRGCLETIAAGPAISRQWAASGSGAAASTLFSAAAAGDQAAIAVASRVTGQLTTALIWMAAAYDTELVVLTGGVASAGVDFLTAMRTEIAARAAGSELAARRLQPDQVVLADPADLPGPRGAALLALNDSLQQRVSPATNRESKQQPLGGTV